MLILYVWLDERGNALCWLCLGSDDRFLRVYMDEMICMNERLLYELTRSPPHVTHIRFLSQSDWTNVASEIYKMRRCMTHKATVGTR